MPLQMAKPTMAPMLSSPAAAISIEGMTAIHVKAQRSVLKSAGQVLTVQDSCLSICMQH